MNRTPAIDHLIAVTTGVTAHILQRQAGGEMMEADTGPIEQVMAMLTPEALGLVRDAHAYVSPAPTLPGDIRYLHIAQESGFSIGVFVLPPGACIPLHDHPSMCVVSHVLYGSVKITCYDRLEGGGDARSGSSVFGGAFGFSSRWREGAYSSSGQGGADMAALRARGWHYAPHTSRLTPRVANVHELEAGGDGAAILDVLIPLTTRLAGATAPTTVRKALLEQQGEGREVGLEWGRKRGGSRAAGSVLPGDDFRVLRGEFVAPFPT